MLALAVAVLFAMLVTGCGDHVLGTHDIALHYVLEGKPLPLDDAAVTDARSRIVRRLSAARVTADVEVAASGAVRIVADSDVTSSIEELLRFRGGLDVHSAGSAPVTSRAQEGALIENRAPDLSLADGISRIEPTLGGRALSVTLTPAGVTALTKLAAAHPDDTAVLGWGNVPLGATRLDTTASASGPLLLTFGDDLASYTRAHRTRLILETPTLPTLHKESASPLPVDAPLATLCIVLPMLLSFAWLYFVQHFDRARPEPFWLVFATFLLGGLSCVPAGFAEYALARLTPYLNPSFITLGGQMRGFFPGLVVFTLVVGVSEEGAKMLGVSALARRRREFDEPVDGIVYGAASSLGFAAVENVKYFAVGRMSGALIASRAFMSIPAHLFFGALWGYAMGQSLLGRRPRIWLFFGLAALAHGAFDTFLSVDGLGFFAPLLNLSLAILFVVLLRRALRHGVVTPEIARLAPSSRTHVRVGSPPAFAVAALLLNVFGLALMLLGTLYEVQNRRVGLGFVASASALVVLVGAAAYAITATLPLDVVMDEIGLTFAGATRHWPTIRGVTRTRTLGLFGRGSALRVASDEGEITVGPGTPHAMDALALAIEARARAGERKSRATPT